MIEPYPEPVVERQIAAQRVFRSACVEIGRFRARPEDPAFRRSGPPGRFTVVLPETSVEIRHTGRSPFVSNLNTVTFYNPEDEYERAVVDPRGDVCTWIAYAPEVVAEALHGFEPDEEAGFRHRFGPSDGEAFLAGRRLVETVCGPNASPSAEGLAIEDAALSLLDRLVGRAYESRAALRSRQSSLGAAARIQRRRLLRRALRILGEADPAEWSLTTLAREVGCSPYHLSRVFREQTSSTLQRYWTELRVRQAVDLMRMRDLRLGDIAAEVGFASHSHLTSWFRRTLGRTPSAWREEPAEVALRP